MPHFDTYWVFACGQDWLVWGDESNVDQTLERALLSALPSRGGPAGHGKTQPREKLFLQRLAKLRYAALAGSRCLHAPGTHSILVPRKITLPLNKRLPSKRWSGAFDAGDTLLDGDAGSAGRAAVIPCQDWLPFCYETQLGLLLWPQDSCNEGTLF